MTRDSGALSTRSTTFLEILAGLICIIAGIALSWWLSV